MNSYQRLALLLGLACVNFAASAQQQDYYGTLEPFASRAVYFLMTDRFVNGDESNDQRDQGGIINHTFDRSIPNAPAGESANIGYLGGDFKGIANNAQYIKKMGFDAIWLTPIVDNPDEAFTGGDAVQWKGKFQDKGKTGYHGYWGSNFYTLDEHLPSPGLDFKALTKTLSDYGITTVLDIVINHGSPAFSMPIAQPKFGQIFDKNGTLIADHQNLSADKLNPENNPLHRFYNQKTEMVQLSDINENNPAVMEYFVGAYLQWIDQGAGAFRIDTIKHMPLTFWAIFSKRIRQQHPHFFMFAEAFDYNAEKIAAYTWPVNGGISVLDFPLKEKLNEVFGKPQAGFENLEPDLYLGDSPYYNSYELMTFYDNHDMARLDATNNGFIDVHNFLFTARGIPVIYYGSEIGFMRGKTEHEGNRNYFGQANIDSATNHVIYQNLQRIAKIRQQSIALQKGIQVNLLFDKSLAAFYRVYQHAGINQTALVLLNKSDKAKTIALHELTEAGKWHSVINQQTIVIHKANSGIKIKVPAHGVEVLMLDSQISNPDLIQQLDDQMAAKQHHTIGE